MRFRSTRRPVRRSSSLIMVLTLTAVMLCAAVPALADGESPDASDRVLRVGWAAQPNSGNPFTGNLICEFEIYHLNYDFLVGFSADDLSPRPELATSWESSNGGKTWTFTLREGVKWSDGEPLTANDVAFTFNYIVKNQISSYTMTTKGIIEATALDDATVQIDCEYPKANILRMWVPILPEHIWKDVPPEEAAGKYLNSPPLVGSGPFQTVEFKPGRYVKLERNEYYWGDKPYVESIVFTSYKNTVAMAEELKTGALDVCWDVPAAQFSVLEETEGITTVDGIRKGFEELGFNCYQGATSKGNPVLKDWKFRRALNWAVDKDKILEVAWLGHGATATSIVQPGFFPAENDYHWEPSDSERYTFDLQKAGEELDAAGYPLKDGVRIVAATGEPVGKLRLAARSNSAQSQRAGKLIAGWFGKLGLDIEYQVQDEATLLAAMYNFEGDDFTPDYDMFFWNWVGAGIDPNFILSVFTTEQVAGWSDSNYSNPEYDELFAQQAETIDEAERKDIVWEMQKILYRETPYIPLVYATNLEAYSDKWEGWVYSPAEKGSVIYTSDNIDSYIKVRPAVTESAAEQGGGNTGLIIAIVVIVVVIVTAVLIFLVMRKRRALEE